MNELPHQGVSFAIIDPEKFKMLLATHIGGEVHQLVEGSKTLLLPHSVYAIIHPALLALRLQLDILFRSVGHSLAGERGGVYRKVFLG